MKKIFKFNRYTLIIVIIALLGCFVHYFYFSLKEKNAYIDEYNLNLSPFDFTIISPMHFKSNGHVYFNKIPIDNADADSFQKFISPRLSDKNVLGIDQYHVYVGNNIVENADPKTFVFLGMKENHFSDRSGIATNYEDFDFTEAYYAKDKNYIYFNYRVIDGADADSFELLHHLYDRDKNFIFYQGKKLENSDADSFIFYPLSHETSSNVNLIVVQGYAKDKNQVYYNFAPIKGADSTTFTPLKGYYAKDKNNVYFAGKIQPKLDVESFEYINRPFYFNDPFVPNLGKIESQRYDGFNDPYYAYPKSYLNGYFRDKNGCYSYFSTKEVINQTWDCGKPITDD